MSGFEVAGLAIGLLPVLVETIKAYKLAAEKIHTFRNAVREVRRLQRRVQTQRQLFQNECIHLLMLVADGHQAKDMLENDSHELWLNRNLNDRLTSCLNDNLQICRDLLLDIQATLKDIQDEFKNGEKIIQPTAPNELFKDKVRRAGASAKFIFEKSKVEKCLVSLKEYVSEFTQISTSIIRIHRLPMEPIKPRRSNRSVPTEYSLVKNTSQMLHEALSMEWPCRDNAHEGHYAGLLVDAKIKDGIRLDMAISVYRQEQNSLSVGCGAENPHWIYMETKPMMKYNSDSSDLPGLVLSYLDNRDDSHQPCRAIDKGKLPIPKINDDNDSRRKKKVRFESTHPEPPSDLVKLPSLSAVELCRTLSAPQPANFCICYLQSPEYLLYTGDQSSNIVRQRDAPSPLKSFSDILLQTRNEVIDPLQKLKTAHRLTTAVLQYHSTPWLAEEWRLHDLHLFSTQENDLDRVLNSLHLSGEFPRSKPTATLMDGIEESQPDSSVADAQLAYGITNPTLFSLGVALLELGHWSPLQSGNDIIAARKLVERGSPLGPRYQDIVKRCLTCNFGYGTNLSRPGLQNAIYNDVACALEDMMSALDIGLE